MWEAMQEGSSRAWMAATIGFRSTWGSATSQFRGSQWTQSTLPSCMPPDPVGSQDGLRHRCHLPIQDHTRRFPLQQWHATVYANRYPSAAHVDTHSATVVSCA